MAKTRADSRRGSGREMSARWKPRRCAIPDRSARLSRQGGGRAELQFLRIDWPSVQRRVLEVVLPQPPWGPVTLQRQGVARTGEIARCQVDEWRGRHVPVWQARGDGPVTLLAHQPQPAANPTRTP